MLRNLGLVAVFVMVFVVVRGAPNALAQFDKYYSPEKRFSIDYLPPSIDSLTPLKITDTQNKTKIDSQYVGISVNITPDPKTMDLD